MGRARKAPARKPLAPKDSNVPHHPQQQEENERPWSLATQHIIDANQREAERRIAAIRAVRDAEVEGYLTQLRIALPMLSEELRAMPLCEFVSKYCPEREVFRSPDSGIIELRPKPQDPNFHDCPSATSSFDFQINQSAPVLHNLAQPTPRGFPFFKSAGKDALLQSVEKMAQNESEDEEFLKFLGSFRSSKFFHGNINTPATDGHVNVGMTPKTMRLPKKGETLLSVNGSPLGVFKEELTTAVDEQRPRRARRRLRSSTMLSKD